MKTLLDAKISDYYILKLIQINQSTTMRRIGHELGVSLGSIHSRIDSLVCRKFLMAIDLCNGSRKKRYQYQITSSGLLYQLELCREIRSCISKELDYINTYEFEKIKHDYASYLSDQKHHVDEKVSSI
jgi:predicted transcriptional regulator